LTPAARRDRARRSPPTTGWRISPIAARAALTVAGTVSGWDEALKVSREMTGKALPLARLLADAIDYAQNGTPVTASQAHATASKFDELKDIPASRKPGWWTVSRRRSGAAFTSPPWPRP
jgi:gamma-glutamyltranspeptidase